jgi:DDE family transposase/transposase IS4-like protein
MRATIAETGLDDKVCQHIDVGMVQEVIPPELIGELLETYQMWEEREQKTNMLSIVYWLIALHLYPRLSQRRVYGKLVSGLRTWHDDVAEQIPARSAFSYRREQLGSELLQELFARCAGPKANSETPGAFWKGMRLLALDGTVESVPDTPTNRAAFRYSSDDATSHSPFPLARLLLLVECGTHLICDAELSSCRQAEAHSRDVLLARWSLEGCLLLWDSGFYSSQALFAVREQGGHVLGRLASTSLPTPMYRLVDGSYLAVIYRDQHHRRGEQMLVRVISYTFTDPRIPGAGEQVYRLVTSLLDPFLYPAKELAVLYHERWRVEVVIDEARTHLRLSARTLRSLTPEGVVQEIYALLLAHLVVRTLMLSAAEQAQVAPQQLSFTETIRILDETLLPLGLVDAPRRVHLVQGIYREIGQQRLPKQGMRIQPRVVKRVRSRYERKQPDHWHAAALELQVQFQDIIELVT